MKPWIARCLCLLMSGPFAVVTHAEESDPASRLQAVAAAPLRVVVSTRPLARLVNSVAPPGLVQVDTLLPPGATPHDATMRPRQVQQLVSADLVLWMGRDVEPYLVAWMQKRNGRSLDISAIDGVLQLPARGHHDDEHAHEHGHTHNARFDIHLWWSRQNLLLAGNAVAEGLMALQPASQPAIARQQTQFQQAMQQLAQEYAPAAANIPPFAVFHDGWQYLEHDLGQQAAAGFVLDGELSMGVRHLAELQQRFRATPVQCVLLEPGMNTALVQKVLPGTPTVTLDPLGWDAPGDSSVEMLRHAYQTLQYCGKNPPIRTR